VTLLLDTHALMQRKRRELFSKGTRGLQVGLGETVRATPAAAQAGISTMLYPEKLEIVPLSGSPKTVIHVPGSKSITNRALVLAAVSGQGCELSGALHSEDTEVMVDCLQRLGFMVDADWPAESIRVGPNTTERIIPAEDAELFVANSGTTMRFVTALVALGEGRYRLDGVPRMRERPIEDLLAALRQLGVRAHSERGNGCPPVVVEANGLGGGQVDIHGSVSSQFLSALLMAALKARSPLTIQWGGPYVSTPYVSMTCSMMIGFGADVLGFPSWKFRVNAPMRFGRSHYTIEPDASAASYFWAAAAITSGCVTVAGLSDAHLQGDIAIVDVLGRMGCRVERCSAGCTVHGRPLHGIHLDMNDISDTVMTLGAVACFADGPTTIRNVAHIRHKETDRLAALATELRRVGAEVDEFADGLTITPRPLHGAEIETYNDHRMAMSMALIGLRVPGIVIKNPACVAKTYPGFFEDLEKLRCV
jgi:3-phosphoshikimate 1-carboxyvinyltransferase